MQFCSLYWLVEEFTIHLLVYTVKTVSKSVLTRGAIISLGLPMLSWLVFHYVCVCNLWIPHSLKTYTLDQLKTICKLILNRGETNIAAKVH